VGKGFLPDGRNLIVGYVTSARPPTSHSLLVGKSKIAFQAKSRSRIHIV